MLYEAIKWLMCGAAISVLVTALVAGAVLLQMYLS